MFRQGAVQCIRGYSTASGLTVGLEIHAQIAAASKLFSGAGANSGCEPNSQVSIFDVALPGTLPVLNRRCVEAAVLTGIALNGQINNRSFFDRKHYFYADLPHGYQITQKRQPIVVGGWMDLEVEGTVKRVGIQQIQLEMDTGKSTRDDHGHNRMLDYNRAGTALMEIVTLPHMNSGKEAAAFVSCLQRLLRHIGSSDGNMDEGSLRVDVNVSVIDQHTGRRSNRVEVKNLNSLRSMRRAIEYEAARHQAAMEGGGNVEAETRTFSVASGTTVALRGKEATLDYRFMIEPDVPPVVLSDQWIAELRDAVPPLPEAVATQLQHDYHIPASTAQQFVNDPALLSYFNAVMQHVEENGHAMDGRTVAKWVSSDVIRAARANSVALSCPPRSASPQRVSQVLVMVSSGEVSSRQAKDMLAALMGGDDRPMSVLVATTAGGGQLTDTSALEAQCDAILKANPGKVAEYQAGRSRLMGMFVGELMKATKGTADPKQATPIFEKLLEKEKRGGPHVTSP